MNEKPGSKPKGVQGNHGGWNPDLDIKKLKLEWFKAWTGVPLIAVPLIAALVSGLFLHWGQVQKARDDFELKAAEIVMSSITPYGSANKADALKKIFPERLSVNFGEAFDPKNLAFQAPDTMNKIELLRLLADKAKDTREIIEYAKVLYPRDNIVNSLKVMSLSANQANSAGAKSPAAN